MSKKSTLAHPSLRCLVLALLWLSPLRAQTTFDTIMERIHIGFVNGTVASQDSTVASHLALINADGSWPDINYADQSQTNWQPGLHLSRLSNFCRAYSRPESSYYGDAGLKLAIVNVMNYWLNLSPAPSSTNWFYLSIAGPKDIGTALIALRYSPEPITTALENSMIGWMTKGVPITQSPAKDGSNLTDVAQHYIMRACLLQDQALLSSTVTNTTNSLVISSGEGIQSDNSYKAHGAQLYLYGYGREYVSGISNIAGYVTGTEYAFAPEKMAVFSNLVRGGFIKPTRGRYADYNVFNRSITRPNTGKTDAALTGRVKAVDLPIYNAEYDRAIQRMDGSQAPSYLVNPEHIHYWRSDYTVHHRPQYMFGLRSVSKRTVKAEMGNGENIKGYYLTEGTNFIGVNGNEYFNIYPVWEWNKIPGTTVPEITSYPVRASWGVNPGTAAFVGGVSDGQYGVSVYAMNDYNTSAKKSWFFFDEEVLCLGAGINSSATQAINTTVNQCLLDGPVTVQTTTGREQLLNGSHPYTGNLLWVHHDSVGYFFPQGGNLILNNQAQSGSQYAINTNYADTPITRDVFKLWWAHGLNPVNNSYAYTILPGKSLAEMDTYTPGQVQIWSNTTGIQAAYHSGLDMLQVVFYEAGTLSSNGITVKANNPCALLLKGVSADTVRVSVADPGQSISSAEIAVQNANLVALRTFTASFPTGQMAGSSVNGSITMASPLYTTPPVNGTPIVYEAVADAYVRDGSYATTNFPTGNLMVKKDGTGYNRMSFLRFDFPNFTFGIDSALLRLRVSNGNTTVTSTQWELFEVPDTSWSETGINWNNQPGVTNRIAVINGQTTGSFLQIPITAAVIQKLIANKKLSIRISSAVAGSTTDGQFNSRESTTAEYRPALLLYPTPYEVEIVKDTIFPIADTWVRSGSAYADKNFGAAGYMVSRYASTDQQIAYLKFDRSGQQGDLLSSELQLYAIAGDSSVQFKLHKVNDNQWIEGDGNYLGANNTMAGAMVWTNAPVEGYVVDSQTNIKTGQNLHFAVTSEMNTMPADSLISFRVTSNKNLYTSFASRQATNVSQRPMLINTLQRAILNPPGNARAQSGEMAIDTRPVPATVAASGTGQANTILIAPNPAGQKCRIQSSSPIQKIIVLNEWGFQVRRFSGLSTKEFELYLQDLPSGIYFLYISGNGFAQVKKIFKSNDR